MMKDNFSCGARIRALRLERGLSQEQLALAAGITPAYLGQVERGVKNPTVQIIEYVCEAMNVSLSAFFSDTASTPTVEDATEKQILGQLSILSTEEKSIVLQVIKNLMQLRLAAIQRKKE